MISGYWKTCKQYAHFLPKYWAGFLKYNEEIAMNQGMEHFFSHFHYLIVNCPSVCHLILLLELSIWKAEVCDNSPVPSSGCVVDTAWSLWLDIWAPWQLMSRMNENIISSISNTLIVVCWPRGNYRKYNKLNLLSPRCFLTLIFNFLCLNKRIYIAPCVAPTDKLN